MANDVLEELLALVPKVDPGRGYWFVRTLSGEYFDDFVKGDYIAIGYDEIPASEMKDANEDEEGFEKLVEKLKKTYKEPKTRHRFIAKQIVKFVHEIKKNDVVMIPSPGSAEVRIGVVEDNRVFSKDELHASEEECNWEKRKKVKWLKSMRRSDLNPELFRMMYTHQAIVDASPYGEEFDKMLGTLYLKGEEVHIIFEVTQKDDIPAKALFGIGNDALELFDEFCAEHNLNFRSTDLNVKIKVESPGWIAITTMMVAGGMLFVLMLSKMAGGSGSTTFKAFGIQFTHQFNSNSLLDKLGNWLVNRAKVRLVNKYIDQLGLENPKEVAQLLQSLNPPSQQLPPPNPPDVEEPPTEDQTPQ